MLGDNIYSRRVILKCIIINIIVIIMNEEMNE